MPTYDSEPPKTARSARAAWRHFAAKHGERFRRHLGELSISYVPRNYGYDRSGGWLLDWGAGAWAHGGNPNACTDFVGSRDLADLADEIDGQAFR